MTYRELFTGENGIFASVFFTNFADDYASIFGDTPASELDTFAVLNYGGRLLNPNITAENCKDIASAVISVYVQGWKLEAAAMLASYDVTNPTMQQRTVTESETENTSADGSDTASDIAFNENDFSDRSKQTTTDTTDRTKERTSTEKITGVGSGKTLPEEIAKEVALRRDIWKKSIIFALVSELTLKVY